MIAGGFSLLLFLKDRSFKDYVERLVSDEHEYNGRVGRINMPSDIDIFVLGNQKEMIANEIIRLMRERFEDSDDFGVFCSKKYGLINIVVDLMKYRHSINVPELVKGNLTKASYDQQTHGRTIYSVQKGKLFSHNTDDIPGPNNNAYYAELVDGTKVVDNRWGALRSFKCVNLFQLIVKNIHHCPSDVFSFFDLDCCKIGYFPCRTKESSVRVSYSFLRSISEGINYCDLDSVNAGQKHRTRIIKYHNRMNIKTTISEEPLLSKYHTLRLLDRDGGVRDYRHDNFNQYLYIWGKNFGQIHKDRNYYKSDPKKTRKTFRIYYFKLSNFEKVELEEVKNNVDLPYMAESVGIVSELMEKMNDDEEEDDDDDEDEKKEAMIFRYKSSMYGYSCNYADNNRDDVLVKQGKLRYVRYVSKRCFVCRKYEGKGDVEKLMICEGCERMFYCSLECKKSHEEQHKEKCKKK